MPNPIVSDPLLSRAEAAAFIGVAVATLEDWASSGRESLPYLRVGRLAKYRQSDLNRWLAARLATSAAGHRAALATA